MLLVLFILNIILSLTCIFLIYLLRKEKKQSLTDPLTSLPNRRLLLLKLKQEIERAKRYGSPLSILFLDINNFKIYNDQHGHHKGDKLLKKVADILKSRLRNVDTIAGLGTGADEFVIILPEDDYANAYKTSKEIKKILRKENVSASIGIKEFFGETIDELLIAADAAMYQDKKNK